jgi:hypothetical protein
MLSSPFQRTLVGALFGGMGLMLGGCAAKRPPPEAPLPVLSVKEVGERVTPLVVRVKTTKGTGSGFVVREGWVATSYRVVEGVSEVRVTLPDGRTSTVDRVRISPTAGDLALLHVDAATEAHVVELGSSTEQGRGKLVVALGPAQESSAKAREEGDRSNLTDAVFIGLRPVHGKNLMQFSEPVPADWTGGPLVNEHGQVVGVLSSDRPGNGALDLGVPVEGLRAMLESDAAPGPVTELAQRAGQGCATYGMSQCSSNCWDAYDGASCSALARMAEHKKDVSLAFDAASRACRLGAPGGCPRASSLLIKHYGTNRPALSEMMDLLLEACSKDQKDACGLVPGIARYAGRPLDAASSVVFLDKGCAGELKSACVDLSRAYAAGDGVKRNMKRAAEYGRRARLCGTTRSGGRAAP